MKEEILLTIAIPTYNRVCFLPRALESVLRQFDPRVEILVSDNAATDGTQDFMQEQLLQYPHIRYIRNAENVGPDKNFLQCYRLAKGRFVLLLGDDDIVADGAVGHILDFLQGEGGDCRLIFLNHTYFQGEYSGIKNCRRPFLTDAETKVFADRAQFMETAQYQLTYMSAYLLQRSAFDSVEDPEKYIGTSFIHTCIALEATRFPDTKFGCIADICIAQNISFEDSGFANHPERVFRIFGQNEEYVLCNLAPQFGYDADQMTRVYANFICSSWPRTILSLKAKGIKAWKKEYLQYGKPAIKKHCRIYRKIRWYAACPDWIAKIIYKVVRPLYKKMKRT